MNVSTTVTSTNELVLEIYGQGSEAMRRRDYSTATDLYWKAFECALEDPDSLVKLGWIAFGCFSSILIPSNLNYTPTKANKKALKALSKCDDKKQKLSIYRAKAFYILGLLSGRNYDDEMAADCLRQAIEVVDSASPSEKQQVVFDWDDEHKMIRVSSEQLLNETKENALWVLRKIEHDSSLPWETPGDLTWSNSPRGISVPNDRPDLKKRTAVGGDKCDECGKTRQELVKANLKMCVCSRCKMVSYCGRDCQRHAWKTGHKKCCRKPDEIKVGDIVQLINIHPAPGGQLVQVLSQDNSKKNHWLVQLLILSDCPPSVYPGKHLKHIRPEK